MRVLSRRCGRVLSAALASITEKYPDVMVDERAEVGSPGACLVEASSRARLVVLGAHARSEMAAVLLGSVSRQVVHHAHCPVAVIRS
jgi:nucleotide-binding universal stress UspA family protein